MIQCKLVRALFLQLLGVGLVFTYLLMLFCKTLPRFIGVVRMDSIRVELAHAPATSIITLACNRLFHFLQGIEGLFMFFRYGVEHTSRGEIGYIVDFMGVAVANIAAPCSLRCRF